MKKFICVRMAVPALWAMTTACWADGLVQPIPKDVLVTTTRVAFREMDAPYAVEVHTREDIQASGAMTLYDYLAKFSGLQVGSAFGNKEAPLLNMRGYGFENGYQNMVVSLNGQRLNAIDQSSPILSAISLDAIEKIEISRGVGSSLYGDGAMAGVVEITTRALGGYRVRAHAGGGGASGRSFPAPSLAANTSAAGPYANPTAHAAMALTIDRSGSLDHKARRTVCSVISWMAVPGGS